MILNSNMIFWTPILIILKLFHSKILHYPFLNQLQQDIKLIRISGECMWTATAIYPK